MKHRKTFMALAAAGLLGLMGWHAPSSAAVAPLAVQAGSAAKAGQPVEKVRMGVRRGFRGLRGRGVFRRGGIFRRGGEFRRRGVFRRGWRGRRYWARRRWRGGRWVAPLVAGAIIGSYAYPRYYRYRRSGSAWQRCDDRFKSFRWSDGTYQPYGGGPRRVCPYLR
ncbi:MAG: BA14K family protein [Hyphomicrobiaceae bacterium]